MSEISYPVRAVNDSVADADGLRISDAAWLDRGDGDTYAIARRIAAALNATQGMSIEDIESLSPAGLKAAAEDARYFGTGI